MGFRILIAQFVVLWTEFWASQYDPLGPSDVILKFAKRRADWRIR